MTIKRALPWLLLVGGIIGVIASAILTSEYINILKDPNYQPVCNLNPIFSCSTVTTSDQAHAFGFPNEFLGLAGFGAVTTVGAALLAGAAFKRWFWRAVNGGLFFAVGFITWLQYEALYSIGSLCLFCMVVWAVTIPIFWYVTMYNLAEGNIKTPKKLQGLSKFVQKHHLDILVLWFLIIIALIGKRFWYYWQTLM